jgi:hypothetical protein
MTVFIDQRLLASREEKKQGASSLGIAREEVSAASGMIGSTREEVGGSETCVIKRRHPGGGGCRHLIVDPLLRGRRARGRSDLPFQGGSSRSDP